MQLTLFQLLIIFVSYFYSASANASFKLTTLPMSQNKNLIERFSAFKIVDTSKKNNQAIILLGGTAMSFETFLHSDSGKLDDSFAAQWVKQGYDVYGIEPREFHYFDHCTKKGVSRDGADCGSIKHWGMNASLDDLNAVLAIIEKSHDKIDLMGFSQGAVISYYAVNQWPNRFRHLYLFEGMVYSKSPDVVDANRKGCEKIKKQLKKGQYLDTKQMGLFKSLSEKAVSRPDSFNPLGILLGIGLFPNNVETFVGAATMKMGERDPSFGRNYQYLVAHSKSEFEYVSLIRARNELKSFTDISLLPLARDYTCNLAKALPDSFDGLKKFKGHVTAFEAEFGMGHAADDSIDLFTGAASKETHFLFGIAHADLLFSSQLQHKYVFDNF